MELTLELFRLAKAYEGRPVLTDCSHRFESGRLHVLMGPNGCGKSTLFRIAALLEKPDRGAVKYFAGRDPLPHDLELKRRISMVFPRVGVFNRTVYHNAAYGLKVRGVSQAEGHPRVLEALELVGLRPKQDQKALTLSSGETMRLGLARALVCDPDVLFLDEPTTSIDQENAAIIEDCLLVLSRDRKMTMILVTHDSAQAEKLGGCRLTLQEGKICEL